MRVLFPARKGVWRPTFAAGIGMSLPFVGRLLGQEVAWKTAPADGVPVGAAPMNVRPEVATDHEAIGHVNRLAFGQDDEARLVDALRDGGYLRLSLVAEQGEQVVGHILFSELPIITQASTIPALALAPLAVLPDFQKQGIGSARCAKGLDECRRQRHRVVVVLGHPTFYSWFGFSPKLAASLDSPFSGRESFMAVELVPGALNGVTGKVQYPPPFNAWS